MISSVNSISFLALDTYSRVGGLQNFNRRVINALNEFMIAGSIDGYHINLMRDTQSDVPEELNKNISAFGASHIKFIMSSLLLARKSDILILGHINLLPVAWLIRVFCPRLKIVLFVHGVEVWNAPIYRKKRFFEPALLSFVDKIASVSQYTADIMAREFNVPVSKFDIFPNAVDGPLRPQNESKTIKTILTVTRMAVHDHGKNIDKLLRAHANLIVTHPDARLEIIGDGALRAELEALADKLKLGKSVAFLGRVSDEELTKAYKRATVFALPSSKEGFGIVYLEAWKYGLPVICSTEGASHEIVDHEINGFCVDPDDYETLSQYLIQLLEQPNLARTIGLKGLQKVENKYLNDSFQKNLLEILKIP